MSRNKHLRDDILEDYHDFEEGEDCCSDGNLVDVIGSLIKARDFYRLQNALDRGAYINFTNKFGEGPLHLAVSQDETLEGVRIVELLLYVGCGVTGQDRFGQTPLHLAAKHAPMYTLKLLEAAAPVNTQDNAGRTALMLACNCGKETALQVVQMLLDRSAIVNIRDQENQTALHYLCGRMGGSDVTVKMEIAYKLLYAGLDVNIRDHSGISAAKMLFRNGQGINLQNVNTDPYLALLRVLARGGSDFQQEYDSFSPFKTEPNWYCAVSDIFLPLSRPSVRNYLFMCIKQFSASKNNCNELHERVARKYFTSAQSLRELSREVVRERLGGRVLYHAGKLGLPKSLEAYLTYLECIKCT
ncbi:uncharacterized protein LOC128224548 isoform X2 [Mya arenaria]|uniref:uncharacterized protein LOC128224548 isoform X2 n=1 Tax=Mya arenaria TaxID=6604 RepID=UPI0022DE9A07|nr:uncharacterized protein LOC128224548 isoform X2 [Mya arenaria]